MEHLIYKIYADNVLVAACKTRTDANICFHALRDMYSRGTWLSLWIEEGDLKRRLKNEN